MNLRRLHTLIHGGILLLLLVLALLLPRAGIQGITEGLQCCAEQIIPALFPFFVLSGMILSDPAAHMLGLGLMPVTRLLGIPGSDAPTALLMGWLGGFTVAARSVSQLYEGRRLTRCQAQRLLIACTGSSPAFVVNAAGLLLLGSVQAGWMLYLALLAANLCCAMAARLCSSESVAPAEALRPVSPLPLTAAVRQAVHATLTVCGFMLFFHFVLAICDALLPGNALLRFFAASLLEVTAGCRAGAALPHLQIYACCAALSLLSLSVLLQMRALLYPRLSLRPVVLTRLLHLPLSLLFLRAELLRWPISVPACSTLAPRVYVRSRVPADAALLIFLLCCVILCRLREARQHFHPGTDPLYKHRRAGYNSMTP